MSCKNLLLFILIVSSALKPKLYAQDEIKTPYFFSINYRTGKNEPHSPKVQNLTYPYRGLDIKMGWQTIGNKRWHQAYRYPSFGAGLNWNTYKTDILGEPVAAYFYTNFPQLTTKYFRIDLEMDLGVSVGLNPYDPVTNPENFAIGSKVNNFFGFYLEQSIHAGHHVDLFLAEGFSHYSNGATSYPNYGLNVPMLKFGARYQPHYIERIPKLPKTKFHAKWDFITYIASGIQTAFLPPEQFHGYVIAPGIYIRPTYKRRFGIGYEMTYDEAMTTVYEKRNFSGKELITHAVFASHEFIIERFTITSQFGIYLKNEPFDTFYYERLGLGFYITPWMRAVLGLKAHRFTAEYLEGALVFDLHLNK